MKLLYIAKLSKGEFFERVQEAKPYLFVIERSQSTSADILQTKCLHTMLKVIILVIYMYIQRIHIECF